MVGRGGLTGWLVEALAAHPPARPPARSVLTGTQRRRAASGGRHTAAAAAAAADDTHHSKHTKSSGIHMNDY